MTNRETLRNLADAVEALSGPCRETDAMIADATMERFGFDHSYAAVREEWWQSKDGKRHYQPPAYTGPIDSAMSLVPEGAGLSINRYWIAKSSEPVWSVEIATGGIPSNPRAVFECFDAATAALALTAASLRAIGEGL